MRSEFRCFFDLDDGQNTNTTQRFSENLSIAFSLCGYYSEMFTERRRIHGPVNNEQTPAS